MKTCAEAKELQRRIALNMDAIGKTALELEFDVEDIDVDEAITHANALGSQVAGLLVMLNKAKADGIPICDCNA